MTVHQARFGELVDAVFGPWRPGTLHATDVSGKTVLKVTCVGADMPYPGWIRMVSEPDIAGDQPVSWFQVPADVRLVRWLPGGDR